VSFSGGVCVRTCVPGRGQGGLRRGHIRPIAHRTHCAAR
jgi:hypothetical protein